MTTSGVDRDGLGTTEATEVTEKRLRQKLQVNKEGAVILPSPLARAAILFSVVSVVPQARDEFFLFTNVRHAQRHSVS